MAALAPIPSASDSTATAVMNGDFASVRTASFNPAMPDPSLQREAGPAPPRCGAVFPDDGPAARQAPKEYDGKRGRQVADGPPS
ncbi:MAG: hypothetical protein AMXMBFR53_30640 [Gemmatimonadota bacterium]